VKSKLIAVIQIIKTFSALKFSSKLKIH
jgi:hypothetical protein